MGYSRKEWPASKSLGRRRLTPGGRGGKEARLGWGQFAN